MFEVFFRPPYSIELNFLLEFSFGFLENFFKELCFVISSMLSFQKYVFLFLRNSSRFITK